MPKQITPFPTGSYQSRHKTVCSFARLKRVRFGLRNNLTYKNSSTDFPLLPCIQHIEKQTHMNKRVREKKRKQNKVKDTSILPIVNNLTQETNKTIVYTIRW